MPCARSPPSCGRSSTRTQRGICGSIAQQLQAAVGVKRGMHALHAVDSQLRRKRQRRLVCEKINAKQVEAAVEIESRERLARERPGHTLCLDRRQILSWAVLAHRQSSPDTAADRASDRHSIAEPPLYTVQGEAAAHLSAAA